MADTNGARIIDCDWNVADSANAIKQTGILTVIRYYSGSSAHAGKILSKSELDALDHAGLSVAVVFQNNNSLADLFYNPNKKLKDVAAALSCAGHVNQPAGTPIYFGVDFDIASRRKKNEQGEYYKNADGDWVLETSPAIQAENEKFVYEYFKYAHEELNNKNYSVGMYGCGRTAELLRGEVTGKSKVADYYWLSASVAYTRTDAFYNSGNWHLFQNLTEIPSDLIPPGFTDEQGKRRTIPAKVRKIDTDVLNDRFEQFGQWRKDGSMPLHPSAGSKLVLTNRAFVVRRPSAPIFEKPDQTTTLRQLRHGKNVRILERRGDGIVAVNIQEGDEIQGYCRVADLTSDLTKMPPWNG
jgi:hypothetical protein